jgi:hypothetical protein
MRVHPVKTKSSSTGSDELFNGPFSPVLPKKRLKFMIFYWKVEALS